MSRRSTTEKTLVVSSGTFPVGTHSLVLPESGCIVKPVSFHATGSGATVELNSGGVSFLNQGAGTVDVNFPDGFELSKDDGVLLTVGAASVAGTFFYILYKDSAPISKEDARYATYIASVAGQKAIRTPSVRAVGDES